MEEFKLFREWAAQAPDVPIESGMSGVEQAIVGDIDMHIRYMLRWEINRMRITADVLARMERAARGEDVPITMKCKSCGDWLDIFEIAHTQPDTIALCADCASDKPHAPTRRVTPSA